MSDGNSNEIFLMFCIYSLTHYFVPITDTARSFIEHLCASPVLDPGNIGIFLSDTITVHVELLN